MKRICKYFALTMLILSFILASVGCGSGGNETNSTSSGKVDYTTGIDFDSTPLKIIDGGVGKYSIIIPSNAGKDVNAVANELNDYFYEVSGARLPIVVDSADVSGDYISLGNTLQFQNSGMDISNIKYDGFIIKTQNNNVFINSNIDKGVMFGVYSFLERFLGIRWLTQTETHVPQSSDVTVYSCDILEEPEFEKRVWYDNASLNKSFYNHRRYYEGSGTYFPGPASPHNVTDYPAANRRSSGYVNKYDVVDKDTGEFIRKYDGNLDESTEIYLKDLYPAFFTNLAGTDAYGNYKPETPSATGGYDICYTYGINEDGTLMDCYSPVSYIVEKIKRALTEDAELKSYKFFHIGEMDHGPTATCHCNTCDVRREKYYGGGLMVMFINAIEKEVNSWLTETQGRTVTFSTFAYEKSIKAPTYEENGEYKPITDACVVNDNVQIRIAPVEADYTYSFADENQLEEFHETFETWDAISKEMRVWDYVIDFYAPTWWYPNLHYLKENLTYYKSHGCVDIFNECFYNLVGSTMWTNSLKSYVVSKLYWNLGWDVDELVNEFIEIYYGVASEDVKEFLNILDGHYAELRATIGTLDMQVVTPGCAFYAAEKYPIGWLTSLISIVDNAIVEMQDNQSVSESEKAVLLTRLKTLKITPMSMIYKNYDSYYNTKTKRDYIKEFLDLCEECNILNIGRYDTVDTIRAANGL